MDTLIKYGVDKELASIAQKKSLTATAIRATSKKNLIEKYNLEEAQAARLKSAVKRAPIDDEVVERLLYNTSYTCCLCKGMKSDAYVIHHIEHYNVSQDNSYDNLAVLCPNDHELAHREGEALANKITPSQVKKGKRKWEASVSSQHLISAALEQDTGELDFISIHRVSELCLSVYGGLPDTQLSSRLRNIGLLDNDGYINPEYYEKKNIDINTPLRFFAPFGSTALTAHYLYLLTGCFSKLKFYDLDNLLNKKSIDEGLIGRYCVYTGGVYGKEYRGKITADSEPTHIYFKRGQFIVEWKVNPTYICSATAAGRISGRPVYLIYGKILNVYNVEDKGRSKIKIEIRPYAFGNSPYSKNRTPAIHYERKYDQYVQEKLSEE